MPSNQQIPHPLDSTVSLLERTGLKFILLYSPARQNHPTTSLDVPTFTEEEMACFQRQVEEGYDLPPGDRYSLWLKMYYPHTSISSTRQFDPDVFRPATFSSSLSPTLPPPPQSVFEGSLHRPVRQLKYTTVLSESLSALPTVTTLKYPALESPQPVCSQVLKT